MKTQNILSQLTLVLSIAFVPLTTIAGSTSVPHSKPKELVKHIASFGTYAIVNLSKDVINDFDSGGPCSGVNLNSPEKIRTFYIDYSATEGRSNYVLIITTAAGRKKVKFNATSCTSSQADGAPDGLPIIDSVETLF